jgi:hypothetical protein
LAGAAAEAPPLPPEWALAAARFALVFESPRRNMLTGKLVQIGNGSLCIDTFR